MAFTLEDKRDKIRSQLLFEMENPKTPKNKADKSTSGLSKRHRFLQNPKNKRDPNEKREYNYKW